MGLKHGPSVLSVGQAGNGGGLGPVLLWVRAAKCMMAGSTSSARRLELIRSFAIARAPTGLIKVESKGDADSTVLTTKPLMGEGGRKDSSCRPLSKIFGETVRSVFSSLVLQLWQGTGCVETLRPPITTTPAELNGSIGPQHCFRGN